MKILYEVLQNDVWLHWKKVEKCDNDDFRSDIRNPLPKNMRWYLAEVETEDLNQFFIISSGDWTDVSNETFRISEVAKRLNTSSSNSDTIRILRNIKEKIKFLDSGGELDTYLIAVTNNSELKGPFTIIEGNRRSVVLYSRNELVGNQFFIGVSPDIREYVWAEKSFIVR